MRRLFKRLFSLDPSARRDPHPNFVKAQIPRSAFTRRGPGVVAELRRVLAGFTQEQRAVCRSRGWDRGLLRKTSGGKWRC